MLKSRDTKENYDKTVEDEKVLPYQKIEQAT